MFVVRHTDLAPSLGIQGKDRLVEGLDEQQLIAKMVFAT
jgi:hypothetical protein